MYISPVVLFDVNRSLFDVRQKEMSESGVKQS